MAIEYFLQVCVLQDKLSDRDLCLPDAEAVAGKQPSQSANQTNDMFFYWNVEPSLKSC